jgi:hypothetical protein
MRDVNYGWLLRYMHANGASFFLLSAYVHIGRGLYFAGTLPTDLRSKLVLLQTCPLSQPVDMVDTVDMVLQLHMHHQPLMQLL